MTTTPPPPDHEPTDPPDGPSEDPPGPLGLSEAESLGERIQQQAALIAESTCELLLMVADLDQRSGVGWFVGLKSTAHWLAWACSMTPGVAREHVRIARALPTMPLTVEQFRAGQLSYSKVREITRVADRVDETTLVDLARAMTVSQLARTISTFRATDGTRLGHDTVRQARWETREDGMIEIRAVPPAEMGAELVTALDLALDRDGFDHTHAGAAQGRRAGGPGPHLPRHPAPRPLGRGPPPRPRPGQRRRTHHTRSRGNAPNRCRHRRRSRGGGLHLTPDPTRTTPLQPRFQVLDTDGRPVQARWPAMLEHLTLRETTQQTDATTHNAADTDPTDPVDHEDPERIAATTGGADFNLAHCVDTLCQNIVELAA